jgi:hypothetical protein
MSREEREQICDDNRKAASIAEAEVKLWAEQSYAKPALRGCARLQKSSSDNRKTYRRNSREFGRCLRSCEQYARAIPGRLFSVPTSSADGNVGKPRRSRGAFSLPPPFASSGFASRPDRSSITRCEELNPRCSGGQCPAERHA